MVVKHEFIQNAKVKFLRLNDDGLIRFPTLLMFRIHDLIEHLKDEPSSYEQIHSIGHKTSGRLYPPSNTSPLPSQSCYCSDPDFFTTVVPNAIKCKNLFHQHNRKLVSKTVANYFHSRFDCRYKPSTTIIVVIEVLRKIVCIGDRVEEPTVELRQELGESRVDIVRDEEDHSEAELRDILGSIYSIRHSIRHRYQLSTNAPTETYRLSQIKASIRTFIFDGKSTDEHQCAICLEGFGQGQHIARIPCSHIFHKDCSFNWLLDRGTCPLCRSSVRKTPIL